MLSDQSYTDDFLWFVNFGIRKSEAAANPESALERCVRNAYQDACRHIDYSLSTSQISEMKKEDSSKEDKVRATEFEKAKNSFINECVQRIRDNINDGLFKCNNMQDFDSWHRKLCKECLYYAPTEVFGDQDKGMTIGQKQKWVNMSIKNMLVMGLWDMEFSPIMDFIHVPIDDNVIKAAKKSEDKDGLGIQFDIPKWNNINDYENEYLPFINCIRDKCKERNTPPIQWEWYAWINHSREE